MAGGDPSATRGHPPSCAPAPDPQDGAVVLVSAQLPVGSISALEHAYAARQSGRNVAFAYSPENLRIGQAIEVFRNPGRIVIGVRDQRTRSILEPLLRRFCDKLIWMSVESAEMVKHALNSFLAVSIAFTNEIATICERVGADEVLLPQVGEELLAVRVGGAGFHYGQAVVIKEKPRMFFARLTAALGRGNERHS